MPELPEVEIIKRGLESSLMNQTIDYIKLHRTNLRMPLPIALETELRNARMIKFSRRGKYILLDLDNYQTILFHLGMSGKMIVQPYNPLSYQKQKHEHLTLVTKEGQCLHYIDARRFGVIDLFPSDEVHSLLLKMGPEPLVNNEILNTQYQVKLTKHLYQHFQKRNQSIKTALLDQHLIAGLGNIYVCEALFIAGISPLRKVCELEQQEVLILVQAIQSILLQAIKVGGSSMCDYVHSDGKKGYFQMQWKVYGQEGEFCNSCLQKGQKRLIKRINQAGRSSFYCEFCQK